MFQINFADRKVESIPSVLQDVIEHLVDQQIMTAKADSCIIDFFNEVIGCGILFCNYVCDI